MLQRTLPAGFIAPCLPTKTDKLPSGSQWLHEIKHDGFRIMARKPGAQVRLYSRPGNDLTRRFPLIADALARLRSQSCIIDGEAVACDDNGVASFNLIRYRRHDDSTFLYAFDLIERACCRYRGLPGCTRYLPRRLPTLAWHSRHLAAGRASNRGQQASARGVESIKSTTFRDVKKAPALPGLQVVLIIEVSLGDGSPRRSEFYSKAQIIQMTVQKSRSLSKKSKIKSSLSFVTSQTGDQWAVDAAKTAAPKYMRSGYEKMRPVYQKVGIRCPFPKFLGWPLVGSHSLLFGSLRTGL